MRATRDLVVVGGSAGAIEAVAAITAGLPATFPAAICVVVHTSAHHRSLMADVIGYRSKLPAALAHHGERLAPGRIYIAPPNRHLLVAGDRLVLGNGPPESRTRPAIDPLFRSAAVSHGPRAIGVLVSGTLDDGTSGLMAIRRGGGITVIQSDATYAEMPENAARFAAPDYLAPVADIPALLMRLAVEIAPGGPQTQSLDDVRLEAEVAAGKPGLYDFAQMGKPSFYACPDCHGVLHEIDEGAFVRFRCHVGHTYTAEALARAQGDDLWQALSSALRALEERQVLLQRMALQALDTGSLHSARQFEQRSSDYKRQAEAVRRVIGQIEDQPPQEAEAPLAAGEGQQ